MPKENKIVSFLRSLPLFFWIALGIGALSALLHAFAAISPVTADWFNRTASVGVRATFGYLTSPFPFSVAELLLIGLPVWAVLLVLLVRHVVRKYHNAKRVLCCTLAVLPLLYSLFVFSMGFGYLGTPLAQKLSLPDSEGDADSLYKTAIWLAEESQALTEELSVDEEGSTVMPYGHCEMNSKLVDAYKALSEEYTFLSDFSVGTKPILLSRPMSYTGITGVYSFFTGEANLNTAYPDYSNAFTAAHEMAHARGIAREDEANFVAFLACVSSDDAYLRYSGYVNLLQYVLNALARADRTLWKEVYADLPGMIKSEFLAYNAHIEKYDNTTVRGTAEKINNTYLESMGTQGTVSYGLVVDLAVAYHQKYF